jgi:hypothetical protein
MNRNIRTVPNAASGTGRLIRSVLIAAALVTAVVCSTWGMARAQSNLADDREAVWMTVGAVYEGWRTLDLNLYMSVWDNGAVQYLQKGTTRNYGQIRADRAASFPLYSRVDVSWTDESIEVYGDKATVVSRYSMTFYKKDGRVIQESEKEFYVLKRQPDMSWRIVENYDYLPK